VITLRHAATGHEIRTSQESVEFWRAAGYREPAKPKPAPKRARKTDK
jgi:hypothetical protein